MKQDQEPQGEGKEMKDPSKGAEEDKKGGGDEKWTLVWDCGSPLYDSFELASFYHTLDRHVMVLPFSNNSAGLSDEPQEFLVGTKEEKKEKARKRIKVVLEAMCGAIAFWRKL